MTVIHYVLNVIATSIMEVIKIARGTKLSKRDYLGHKVKNYHVKIGLDNIDLQVKWNGREYDVYKTWYCFNKNCNLETFPYSKTIKIVDDIYGILNAEKPLSKQAQAVFNKLMKNWNSEAFAEYLVKNLPDDFINLQAKKMNEDNNNE